MHISTFEKNDAITYNLDYKHQFSRHIDINEKVVYDYYYIGHDKGRTSIAHNIIKELNNLGLKGLCIIPKDKNELISYKENIQNVMKCNILIEVLQEGQQDITLRAIEALFYKKKLITTCKAIQSYDFYSPNNILIWGEENHRLESFIQSEYDLTNQNYIEEYTFTTWLKSFK